MSAETNHVKYFLRFTHIIIFSWKTDFGYVDKFGHYYVLMNIYNF